PTSRPRARVAELLSPPKATQTRPRFGDEQVGTARRSAVKGWAVGTPGPLTTRPLVRIELQGADPGPGEIRVRVSACGVCRTDLHLAEGDLAPRRPRTVPGHEVVGIVD